MPAPVQKPDKSPQGSDQKQKLPQKQSPEQPPVKKQEQPPKQEKPKAPKQPKNEALKFTMVYANGGFNNGVELKPGKDGKVELSIAIYGGGEQKTLGISGIPPEIEKIIKGYEIGASSDQDTPEIVDGLKDYFNRINQVLSMKIISILQEADDKIALAIKETFKQVK